MDYELAKKAKKLAEEISIRLYGSKTMAELCLPAAYEQLKQQTIKESKK